MHKLIALNGRDRIYIDCYLKTSIKYIIHQSSELPLIELDDTDYNLDIVKRIKDKFSISKDDKYIPLKEKVTSATYDAKFGCLKRSHGYEIEYSNQLILTDKFETKYQTKWDNTYDDLCNDTENIIDFFKFNQKRSCNKIDHKIKG